MAAQESQPAPASPDWYVENGLLVYTAAYHLKRGQCCGSGCRHCPYEPEHVAGTRSYRLRGDASCIRKPQSRER